MHSGTVGLAIRTAFGIKMGVPWGAVFIHFRVFSSVVFSFRFRSVFSVVQGPKRVHFGTPRGSEFVLSPRRRAIFKNIVIFMKSCSQKVGGVVLGVSFGCFFYNFNAFRRLRFASHFGVPAGTENNCFFGGSVGCGRRLTGCGAPNQNPSGSTIFDEIGPEPGF